MKLDISHLDIMNIFTKYIPMTETAYYILMVINEPLHGYGIIQKGEQITEGRIRIGAGTIYETLSKLEKDGVIDIVSVTERRKIYVQSDLGKQLIKTVMMRSYTFHRCSPDATIWLISCNKMRIIPT
jgi:DNA-binding PadR family transcriptional regulator